MTLDSSLHHYNWSTLPVVGLAFPGRTFSTGADIFDFSGRQFQVHFGTDFLHPSPSCNFPREPSCATVE